MKVKVLYFAGLREQLGTRGEDLEVSPAVTTVAGLRTLLMARGGAWHYSAPSACVGGLAGDSGAAGTAPARNAATASWPSPSTVSGTGMPSTVRPLGAIGGVVMVWCLAPRGEG